MHCPPAFGWDGRTGALLIDIWSLIIVVAGSYLYLQPFLY